MHTHTSRGDGQAHRWARWDLGRLHRWTVANWRYADYRSHRMADGCCADGTARTMGVRRWEPRGAHLRTDQCMAVCSTTFGIRWGRGDLSWHAVGAAGWGSGSAARLAHMRRSDRRVRAARLPAHARGMPAPAAASAPAPPGWRTRGAPCAGSPPPLELCKLCPGAACCKARKPALVCGGAFVERYRGWLGLRRPHCISY